MQNHLLTTVCGIALIAAIGVVEPVWAVPVETTNPDGTVTVVDGNITIVRSKEGATLSRTETLGTYTSTKDYRTGATTNTTKNADGSTVVTVKAKDGSTTKTETKTDGTNVVTTTKNGVTETVTTEASGKKTKQYEDNTSGTKMTVVQNGNTTETSVTKADGYTEKKTVTTIQNADGTTREAVVSETVTADGTKTVERINGDSIFRETTDKSGEVIAYEKQSKDPTTGVQTYAKKDENGDSFELTTNPDGTYSQKKTENGVTTEVNRQKNADGKIEETTTVTSEGGMGVFAGDVVSSKKTVYDENGQITEEVETSTKKGGLFTGDSVVTTTTSYDESGNKVGVKSVDSDTGEVTETKYTYGANNEEVAVTTKTDEKGNVLESKEVTTRGDIIQTVTTDPETGKTVTTVQSGYGLTTESTMTNYKDENGNWVTEKQYPDGSSSKSSTEIVQKLGNDGKMHDVEIDVVETTDALGNKTTVKANEETGAVSTTIERKDGTKTVTETYPTGTTEWAYAADGKLASTTETVNTETGYKKEVTVDGKVVASETKYTDANGDVKTSSFDERTGTTITSTERADGSKEKSVVVADPNDASKVLKTETTTTNSYGVTETQMKNNVTGEYSNTTFDASGALIKEDSQTNNPDGSVTKKQVDRTGETKDKDGNSILSNVVTEKTDANGRVSSTRETVAQDPQGNTINDSENVAYDANGNRVTSSSTAIVDADGQVLSSGSGTKTEKLKADGTVESYTETYDAVNNETGEKVSSVTTVNADKSSSKVTAVTKKDGTIIETDIQTDADGKSVETVTTTNPDGTQNIVQTTKDTDGNVTGTITQNYAKDKSSVVIIKDAKGNVIRTMNLSQWGVATKDSTDTLFKGTQFEGMTWHGLVDTDYGATGQSLMDNAVGAVGGVTLTTNPTKTDFE